MKAHSNQAKQQVASTNSATVRPYTQEQETNEIWSVTNTKFRAVLIILGGLLLLAAVLIVPWLLRPFTADVIYVRPVAVGNGTGTSWAHATTLRDALQNRAHARDEIWIAVGVHYPTLPRDLTTVTSAERDTSFVVRSRVALYGGFAGHETDRSQRDPETHLTVLSGDIDQNGVLDAGNSRTVVDLSGTDALTVLDGITITGGNSSTGGSGILNIGGSPHVTNVVVKGNTDFDSGSVYNSDNGNPTFTNVTIRDNDGFGMINIDSDFTFRGGTIKANRFYGVNIIGLSNPTFTNVDISDNLGGVYILNILREGTSNPTFTDVTISNNRGRGVYIEGPNNTSFTNVTINDNGSHGLFISHGSNVVFTTGVISGNGGQGVFNSSSVQSVFVNVHITDNAAGAIINNTDMSFHNTSATDN